LAGRAPGKVNAKRGEGGENARPRVEIGIWFGA
jgi:hypothetical protein